MILDAKTLFVQYNNNQLSAFKVHDGVVGESYVPDTSEVYKLVEASVSVSTKAQIIPPELLSIEPNIVFFVKPDWREMTISSDKKRKYNVYFPGFILIMQRDDLFSFAVKERSLDQITPDTELYHIPLPNVYMGGSLCYGAANKFQASSYSYQQIKELMLETLFGVSFTLHFHNKYRNLYPTYRQQWKTPRRWLQEWDNELIPMRKKLSLWL